MRGVQRLPVAGYVFAIEILVSETDFPKSAARASEGFCPLCDRELVRPVRFADRFRDCESCLVAWEIQTIDGRVVLFHSRDLTHDEIKRLHDREAG